MLRGLRSGVLLGVAAGLLGLQAATALAAFEDLTAAEITGPWNLVVTITGYTGGSPGFTRPTNTPVADKVWFDPSCTAPGSCTVRIWGPSGPNPSQAGYYQYFGTTSGFQGTTAAQPLQQSGASYSASIPIGGFGGRLQCPPPSGGLRPSQEISLRVTAAKQAGSGWLATAISGGETLTAGWACSGSQPTGWVSEHLVFTGHPVGYVAPAPAGASSTGLTVSSLASSLNPPDQAFRTPSLIAVNLVVTALVILFVTFPSALFNHTLSSNYEEIAGVTRRFSWLRRLLEAGRDRAASSLAGRRRETAIFAAVVLVGAWINGQLDPRFGFNGLSVVSYAATLVNICFGVAFSGLVAMSYRRARGRDRAWRLNALPLGLAVAAACVLVSRLTGFQPGYFYGLVLGIAFGSSLARHEAGHTAALAALATMTVAVLAWLAWAAVNPNAVHPGAAWPLVLLDDFLGSVFVGGLVGNVVGLLPLGSLQGGTLIGWRRSVWAVIFAIAVFGLVQVLLHPEQGKVHPSTAPLVTAILLFVVFGGGSVAFNRYFAWGGRPTRLQRPPEPVPIAAAPRA